MIIISTIAQSQTHVFIHKKDGTVQNIPITEIDSITHRNISNDCSFFPYWIGTTLKFLKKDGKIKNRNAISDTLIGSKKYLKYKSYTVGLTDTSYSYIHFDNNGTLYAAYPNGLDDINQVDIAYVKVNEPVGATWEYSFPSYSNNSLYYKIKFKVISKNEVFKLGNTDYTGGIKIEEAIEIYNNNTFVDKFIGERTWFCGLGLTRLKKAYENEDDILISYEY